MAWDRQCDLCATLQQDASAAVTRHVKAVGRLELARLSRDFELLRAMEIVVNEAATARQAAVSALKAHLESHETPTGPSTLGAKETTAGSE
jgi:hypothetical protein